MPDLPARRIDDRELRPELALAGKVIGDAARMLACFFQPKRKLLHTFQSNQ
jgi:hypothetical protein